MSPEAFQQEYLIAPPRWLFLFNATAGWGRRVGERSRGKADEAWLAEAKADQLTLLKWPADGGADCARRFSRALGVRALHLWHEDVSMWAGYTFFIDGERHEAFEFGMNDEEGEDFDYDASGTTKLKPIKCRGWTQAARDDEDDFHYHGPARPMGEFRPGWEFIIRRLCELGFELPRRYPREQAVRLTPP